MTESENQHSSATPEPDADTEHPLDALARRLRARRLGVRAQELLGAGCKGDIVAIPVESRAVNVARLRAARNLRDMGLAKPARGKPRELELTAIGRVVAEEVAERHRAGVAVRWDSVLASIRHRYG